MSKYILDTRIGYACVNPDVRDGGFKTCRLADASYEKLYPLISHNLDALEKIIEYNAKNHLLLFRISSDLIPFGSRPEAFIDWRKEFKERFSQIGKKISESGMRVSMHPGQYTVLNSKRAEVAVAAVRDLVYHADVLSMLGTDSDSKIILHIGGAYGNKDEAKHTFVRRYHHLSAQIKKRLVIENDDKLFNISDLLWVSEQTGAPVVYDNLHDQINPSDNKISQEMWIEKAADTWNSTSGRQKIHYSQQDSDKKGGAHSQTIDASAFIEFYSKLVNRDIDIMLEVKDKNRSAIKVNLCLKPDIRGLEREWARYKYLVLGKDAAAYHRIRTLLKEKQNPDALSFYEIIDSSLRLPDLHGRQINALMHVWGYFKNRASDHEKIVFSQKIKDYADGTASLTSIRKMLLKLSLKYQENYLLDGYFFS
ncbi:MAG: UV DNA damage repair endonuclease UvsE [Clostridiales bacterium]|nr:UV DNA damage repair endonuclease UvsE [Clostridiales bacterium]